MRSSRLVVALTLALTLTGCFNAVTRSDLGGDNDDSMVKLVVEWDSLEANDPVKSASISPMALSNDISVIGARVVAPDINALLAQSATKQEAETEGVITIPVPALNDASLYAVAVDTEGNAAMLGILEGISVPASTVLTITSDELTWISPDAAFTGEVLWRSPSVTHTEPASVASLESGVLTAPDEIAGQGCGVSEECSAFVFAEVTDPFHSSPAHPMICMAGPSVSSPCYGENFEWSGDWVTVALACRSSAETACSGAAYVDGPLFSLPDQYPFGPQFGPFDTIDWRP